MKTVLLVIDMLVLVLLVACSMDGEGLQQGAGGAGGVVEVRIADAGAGGMGGAGGVGGAGGALSCSPNTIEDCRTTGQALVAAVYWCREGYDPTTAGTCTNGRLVGYFSGLSCPYDVIIATDGTTPPPDAAEGLVVINSGGSTSAVWRNDSASIYCCEGNFVKKVARCR